MQYICTREPVVVPRKGDVDRNDLRAARSASRIKSSPARGTWIEIHLPPNKKYAAIVVPRKGDVDRNCNDEKAVALDVLSSPARGTWIEIADSAAWKAINAVVPARGTWIEIPFTREESRKRWSSPARGTWIEMPRESIGL